MSNLGKQHLERQTALCGAGVYIIFAKRRNYHIRVLTLKIKVKHLYFSSRRRENGHFSFGLFPDLFAVPKYNALEKKLP